MDLGAGQDAAMRRAFEDPELRELVHRYVTPERRYMRLLGGDLMHVAAPELQQFTRLHQLLDTPA
ncbi:hypothetical protein ACU686_15995 [Yinghuangia aomiensis]